MLQALLTLKFCFKSFLVLNCIDDLSHNNMNYSHQPNASTNVTVIASTRVTSALVVAELCIFVLLNITTVVGNLMVCLQSQTITLDSGFLFPQVQKNIERKVDIIVATLKEGKRGRAFF